MGDISKNYSYREFIKSNTATRMGIDNSMSEEEALNVRALVLNVLQPMSDVLGGSTRISSGFRCDELNTILKGADNSDHVYGKAGDIENTTLSNIKLAEWIDDNIPEFKQLILEYPDRDDDYAGWIHISYDENNNKREVLTAIKVDSKTMYVPGLQY